MELLNIVSARAMWFFDIAELNPRGKTVMPELLEWLSDNYHFERAPASVTDVDKDTKALVFERGQFQAREEFFVNVGLKIYSDGFIAETQSSTVHADAFLEDVLTSAAKEFGLTYKPQMIRTKLYFSEVNVYTTKRLAGMNPRLSELAARISELVPSGVGVPYEVAGFACWATQASPPLVLAPFRFERKIGTLPPENKYYSTAPLHTEDHLRVLEEFEGVFMA